MPPRFSASSPWVHSLDCLSTGNVPSSTTSEYDHGIRRGAELKTEAFDCDHRENMVCCAQRVVVHTRSGRIQDKANHGETNRRRSTIHNETREPQTHQKHTLEPGSCMFREITPRTTYVSLYFGFVSNKYG